MIIRNHQDDAVVWDPKALDGVIDTFAFKVMSEQGAWMGCSRKALYMSVWHAGYLEHWLCVGSCTKTWKLTR